MSVSSGSDITIPIQDSPPPPPSPYGGSKGNDASTRENKSSAHQGDDGVGGTVTIIDTSAGAADADGGGGKSTPEPRGDVTVTVGFVNEGYQNHSPEEYQNHSEKNGHSKMGNGQNKRNSNGAISISVPGEGATGGGGEKGDHQEIHLNEAVNPELINMNILNTIPDKPNPEYGPYDNLDEYFVPVNTHKKFLRSEKLYVTKDKRKETHWKKYVCWVLGATILAAIVTVAVLAGIGLIPQKSPNHFDSVVGTTDSSSGDLSSEDIIISSSPESSLPSSTEINTPPSVPVDASYVPMAADMEFRIENLDFEVALYNKSTERFQQLASEIEDKVKEIIQSKAGLGTVYAHVNEFGQGSVIVKMRIGWLNQAMNVSTITQMLANISYVGEYKIFATSTYQIVNKCRFNNNNGCSHNCSFDYMQLDFFCSCGKDDSLYLSPEDKKTCLSIYDASSSTTSTSTTTEIPLISSEFSSFSPSISEEVSSSPAPIVPLTSSEESVSEHVHQHEEEEPTYQPEEEEHNHHVVSEQPSYPFSEEKFEYESSTEGEQPSDVSEPHSQEHHHEEPETVPVVSSTTTTTTTSTTEAPAVSEEVIQPERIDDVSQPIVAPIETTTTTTTTTTTPTPEPLPILISSSEESQPPKSEEETTSHPDHSQEEEQLPVHHESVEQHTTSDLHSTSSGESTSEELGRTELVDDEVKPTEPIPVIPEEPKSESGENTTIVETPRDASSESEEKVEQVPVVSSTEAPVEVPVVSSTEAPVQVPVVSSTEAPVQVPIVEDIPETTVNPPVDQVSHEEVPVQQVSQEEVPEVHAPEKETSHEEGDHSQVPPVVPVPEAEEEQETTTVVSGSIEDDEEGTTVASEGEQNFSQDISPIDVLSFPSSKEATTSTTSMPVFATHAHSGERSQGRSVSSSGESSSEVESLSEAVTGGDPVRSQNLSEDDSPTERSRDGRRLFTEDNSMQSLENVDDKEKEREELINSEEQSRSSQNVTETASVETADEKPEVALAVTKTSSNESDAISAEVVTEIPAIENESSQSSQSGSAENGNNISGLFGSSSASAESSEISQESPVADNSESTTVPPRHLHHDIDINNLLNNTEDKVNSEHVEVEGVQDDHVVIPEEQVNTNDKLVEAPEEDLPIPETTTAPVLPASSSAESLETFDEFTGSTSRGIIGNADLFSSEDLSESPNRDHRDTNADIETPSSLSSSQEEQEEIVTTAVPLTTTSTTTTSTTTTTTSAPEVLLADATTTTTTSAPETLLADVTTTTTTTSAPEVSLPDITSTTTTTTTPAPPVTTETTNVTETGSISSIISKEADSLPLESSLSASDEDRSSSSQLLSHESYSSSSSPEEEKSLVEPTEASSASFETGSLPSLESNSAGSDDQQNELT